MSRRTAATRRWKNVDLRRERDPRRNVKLILTLLAIAGALAPLVTYVMQQNRYVKTQYQIRSAENQYNRLVEEEQRYMTEKARMQNLDRAEAAAPRIGLERPETDRVVWARPGTDSTGERVAQADR